METTYRTAYVYVRETFAGTLKETDEGYSFIYDEKYLESPNATHVSLTLPSKKKNILPKRSLLFLTVLFRKVGF